MNSSLNKGLLLTSKRDGTRKVNMVINMNNVVSVTEYTLNTCKVKMMDGSTEIICEDFQKLCGWLKL